MGYDGAMDTKGANRFFLSATILIAVLSPAVLSGAADQRFSDLRTISMGSAGIAFADSSGSPQNNPASLFILNETNFLISTSIGESIVPASYNDSEPIPWMQEPATSLEFLLSNRYVSFSLGLGYTLSDRPPQPGEQVVTFDASNDSRFQLTAAYGWDHFAFGVFARGGNTLERTGIEIREDNAITDYLLQTYLERYEQKADGQFFSSGIGLLLSYPWVSIGLLTEPLFEMDYDTNEFTLDATGMFEGLSVGLAFTSPVFNRNNELNPIAVNAAFDVRDLGDEENRSVRMGLEVKFQFRRDLWVAVRGGYLEYRSFGVSLFDLDGSGETTYGLGVQWGPATLAVAVGVPLSMYSDASSNGISARAGISWNL